MSTLSPSQQASAKSSLDWLASLDENERTATVESLSPSERIALNELLCDWTLWAREKQLPPSGDWFIWMVRAGRGFGKTRTGAEYVRSRIDSGEWRTVNVAGPTKNDVLDIMLMGTPEAPGLLGVWPEHQKPKHDITKMRVRCHNGALIRYRSADEPERFRGPQADGGWCDEIDSWKPKGMTAEEAWGLYELGIRLGPDPRIIATSTPKRSRLVKMLCERDDTVVTVGSTYENRANLAPQFFRSIVAKYEGTRLGRQEIHGELLEDVEGALVTLDLIGRHRVAAAPELRRVVVGVDPSGTAHGDEQGIVGAALGCDGHGYVLSDRSCSLSPEGWGRRAVDLYHDLSADRLVVEVNYGGDMVESLIRSIDPRVNVRKVTASRGKHVRFEPVAGLYEQGRIHHVGTFDALEDQICSFTAQGYEGDTSPDRADAAVWALTDLMLARVGPSPSELYGSEGAYATA